MFHYKQNARKSFLNEKIWRHFSAVFLSLQCTSPPTSLSFILSLFFKIYFLPQWRFLSLPRDFTEYTAALPVLRVFHCEKCRIRNRDHCLRSLKGCQWATTSLFFICSTAWVLNIFFFKVWPWSRCSHSSWLAISGDIVKFPTPPFRGIYDSVVKGKGGGDSTGMTKICPLKR